MAVPLPALVGLCVGALGTGAVVLGGAVAGLSLGPIAGGGTAGSAATATATAPFSASSPGSSSPGSSSPVLSTDAFLTAEAAASSCPGLDWALLAAAALMDPVLEGGLTSVAATLCPVAPADRPAALAALLPGPTQGEVAVVLAWALTSDPGLTTPAATAVSFAAANLGAPYRWGGTGPGGFDCSGLTQAAYAAAHISIPRVAQDQFDAGPPVTAGTPLRPGDLVFFGSGPRGISHVGLYIGGGDMIDAPHTGAFVRVEPTPSTPGAAFGSDLYVGATRPGS